MKIYTIPENTTIYLYSARGLYLHTIYSEKAVTYTEDDLLRAVTTASSRDFCYFKLPNPPVAYPDASASPPFLVYSIGLYYDRIRVAYR